MSKVLIFSDLHLHNWQYGATYDGKWNSRLLDQRNVCDQIVQLASEHSVDFVVFCGDLFHVHGKVESGPLSVASDLFYKLSKIAKHVYILTGNHDMGRDSSSIAWLSNLGDNITVVEDSIVDTENRFGFVSYTSDPNKLEKCLDHLKTYGLNYWFLHQGVKDVPVGTDFVIPNEIFDSSMIPQGVKMAFTGHYHRHRLVGDHLTIIGAPMQHTWSDKDDVKGCLLLDVDTDEVTFLKLKSPYFRTLNEGLEFTLFGSFSNTPLTFPIELNDINHIEGNFIRVEGEVPYPDKVRKLLLEAGARSVEFTFKKEAPVLNMKNTVFDLHSVVDKYIKLNKIDSHGKEIGNKIREGNYEAPAFES